MYGEWDTPVITSLTVFEVWPCGFSLRGKAWFGSPSRMVFNQEVRCGLKGRAHSVEFVVEKRTRLSYGGAPLP